MDQLGAIRLFTRVAQTGNFSQVARELNIGQPAVSKQVAWLEQHLGAQLLHRTSRRVRLTEEGQAFYDAAVRLLGDVNAAENLVGRGALRPFGKLSVSTSAGFGRLYLVPLLPSFRAQYPDLEVELVVADRFVDLVEEGIDLAVRIAELSDSTLMARRLGQSPRVTVAAPSYLTNRRPPHCPEALAGHDCVVYTFRRSPNPWRFSGANGPVEFLPKGGVRTNDAEILRASVLAGLGVAQAPRWLFAQELTRGEVVEVLSACPPPPTPIHAVYPPARPAPSKVTAFVEFVARAFAEDPTVRPDGAAGPGMRWAHSASE